MRINKINIRNFKGFEQKTFELDNRMTVIVGNNASGKTTLLDALQVALGAFLKGLKGLSGKAYTRNFSKTDAFKRYIPAQLDFVENDDPTRIEIEGEAYLSTGSAADARWIPINWWRKKRGSSTLDAKNEPGSLLEYIKDIETRRNNLVAQPPIYPLVLSFGAKRIDNQYREAQKTKERASRIGQAYKSALRETVDFKSAFDWMYRYQKSLGRGNEFEGTREAFLDAITTAIPALSNIYIDEKNKEFTALVTVRGQEPVYRTYDTMSDGFKSMICIVAEIAYRCIQLNGFMGREAVRATPGVVMIDEVDLYLHPRWQKHILKDLQEAFPLIQFVVSTHSPFIIQSVRTKNVITLDGVNDTTDPIFRSIEEISQSEMGIDTPRSAAFKEMVKVAERYYQMVKEGADRKDLDNIKEKLDAIEIEFSSDPAYVALLKAERASQ